MAEGFKRPGKVEFEPPKQTEVRSDFHPPESDPATETPVRGQSRAEVLINEYDKTIAFAQWLEGILDDQMKDVVVEIDPEEQPEVWMAMQRIFSTPNPKISYKSYVQVLAAIEQVENLEATVDNPFDVEDQFIESFTKQVDEDTNKLESETVEMEVDGEDPAPTTDPVINTIGPTIPKTPQTLAEKLGGNSGN